MSGRIGNGSNSNGQFWYGNSTNFPGFLYKKNVGVGGRRSTKFGPGGNITCNSKSRDIFNKYKPGTGGVGASSIANRRAKNRHATICTTNNCFPCYMTLGQYNRFLYNPNGFYPCPPLAAKPVPCVGATLVPQNTIANMNTDGMQQATFIGGSDDGYSYLSFENMDFYFFGTNYGQSDGTVPANSIYVCTNFAFGFGLPLTVFDSWPPSAPAILFDFFDSITTMFVSPPVTTSNNVQYVRIVMNANDFNLSGSKAYEIYYIRDQCYQYMQFNCSVESVNRSLYYVSTPTSSNITNGVAFQNTFGAFGTFPLASGEGPQTGGSYVIRSDLNGFNWQFFSNYHLVF